MESREIQAKGCQHVDGSSSLETGQGHSRSGMERKRGGPGPELRSPKGVGRNWQREAWDWRRSSDVSHRGHCHLP